jgi:hypothetical protein
VADTCPHGFPTGTCLICQTLGTKPTKGSRQEGTATLEPETRRRGRRSQRDKAASPVAAERVKPTAVSGPPERSPRTGLHLLGVVVGLAVLAIAAFALVGVVLSALRVFELVVIGVAAAWGGYHLGYFRGSRSGRSDHS